MWRCHAGCVKMVSVPASEAVLREERTARILRTVAMERPDRTPVVLEFAGFAATVTGNPMTAFLASVSASVDMMIQAFRLIGPADAVDYGAYSPYALCSLWMSKVKVPGVDLPPDAALQVAEAELMTPEDYDRILSRGWPDFQRAFLEERVFNDVAPGRRPSAQTAIDVRGSWAAQGIPVLSGGDISPPFELLCGARSVNGFYGDLLASPDKVREVMDAITPHLAAPVCAQAKAKGFPAVWVGGWRSASKMISPRIWQRFVGPYLEKLVRQVVESGLIAILHLDYDWTRDLGFFRCLPKGKCILSTDGRTDLRKAREILGGHMCLAGDVPAEMLAFGTPDEVHRYATGLIRDLGPAGFILHSGCDIPENAKLENVRAMVAAALSG